MRKSWVETLIASALVGSFWLIGQPNSAEESVEQLPSLAQEITTEPSIVNESETILVEFADSESSFLLSEQNDETESIHSKEQL